MKKTLSILLSVILMFAMTPLSAFAEVSEGSPINLPPMEVRLIATMSGGFDPLGDPSLDGKPLPTGVLTVGAEFLSAYDTVELYSNAKAPDAALTVYDGEGNPKTIPLTGATRELIGGDTRCKPGMGAPPEATITAEGDKCTTSFKVAVIGDEDKNKIINKCENLLKHKIFPETTAEATYDEVIDEIDAVCNKVAATENSGISPKFTDGISETRQNVSNGILTVISDAQTRITNEANGGTPVSENVKLNVVEKQQIDAFLADGLANSSYWIPACGVMEGDTITVQLTGLGDSGETDKSDPVSFVLEAKNLGKWLPAEGSQIGENYKKAAVPKNKKVTYNGKKQSLTKGEGYTLSGTTSAINAGTYKATATLISGYIWSDGTKAPKTVVLTIGRRNNPLTAKGKTVSVSAKTLKKKKVTVKRSKAIAVSNVVGDLVFKKVNGNKKITVAKNGTITVKKGLKKGKYKVKIKVLDSGNRNYKNAVKNVTVIIRVK